MKNFYVKLDAKLLCSLKDNPRWPLEKELPLAMSNLDGGKRFATLISALPEGVDMRTATRTDFGSADYLQAGGAADRMFLQLGRSENGRQQLYNVSFQPTQAGDPETEDVQHGPGHTTVRPEEIMTWEQAVPLMCHYVRNNQTLPTGVWLRDYTDLDAAAFQVH